MSIRDDFIKLENKIVDNHINANLWPLLKYSIYNIHRQKLIIRRKKERNFFVLFIMTTYSIFLLLSTAIANLYKRNKFKCVFGASTRLADDKDWLLGEGITSNSLKLYHFSSVTWTDAKRMFGNKVIAVNILIQIIVGIIKPFSKYIKRLVPEKDDAIIDFIVKNYKSEDCIKAVLNNDIKNFYLEEKAYKFLFWVLNFQGSEAIVISAYSKCAVISSLKMTNNFVVEYQHGLIAPFHPVYGFNSELESKLIVDEYRLISHFWLEVFKKYESRPLKVYRPEYFITDTIDITFEKPYVIFTSQDENYEKVIGFITQFLENINDIVLVYRPHPRGDSGEILTLFSHYQNFYYSDNEEKITTRALIKNSLAHVSMYSACHFDAFELLGKSYFLGGFNQLLFPKSIVGEVLKDRARLIVDINSFKKQLELELEVIQIV